MAWCKTAVSPLLTSWRFPILLISPVLLSIVSAKGDSKQGKITDFVKRGGRNSCDSVQSTQSSPLSSPELSPTGSSQERLARQPAGRGRNKRPAIDEDQPVAKKSRRWVTSSW